MLFFHDGEFLEDGKTIDLLSYAIVAESGDDLYLVNAEADWGKVTRHPWLRANVIPHLPGGDRLAERDRLWEPDPANPRVLTRAALAARVEQFIASFGEKRSDHELWAWYGAYDHVALAQLFGPMMNLPACVPMHTNDLKTLVKERRVPEILRTHVGGEHDALADARWDRLVYSWIKEQERRELYGWRQRVARREAEIAGHWAELPDDVRQQVRHATRGRTFARLLDDAAGLGQQ